MSWIRWLGILCCGLVGPGWDGHAEEPATAPVAWHDTLDQTARALGALGLHPESTSVCSALRQAVFQSADSGSRPVSKEEAALLQGERLGQCWSLGLQVEMVSNEAVIRVVSPAVSRLDARVTPGALLTKVGEDYTAGSSPLTLERLLCGPTRQVLPVEITTVSNESISIEIPTELTGERSVVSVETWPSGLGYLKVKGLYAGGGAEMVRPVEAWATQSCAGLILDIRNAGGHDLESVRAFASLLTGTGTLLFSQCDLAGSNRIPYVSTPSIRWQKPVLVIVDEKTRGAAEVLAAVLAGGLRGSMLVGRTTAGDAGVRDVIFLPDETAYLLAVRKIVLVGGRELNGSAGVVPHLVIASNQPVRADYVPDPAKDDPEWSAARKKVSPEEMEQRKLYQRVAGDPALQRAVDVLLGLKAIQAKDDEEAAD